MTEDSQQQMQELLMHHEKQIAELNEVVTTQWAVIDRLQKQVEHLYKKLDQLQDEDGEGHRDSGRTVTVSDIAAANKPPHY
jgi:SlyX protein